MTPEQLIKLTTIITLCTVFVLLGTKVAVWSFTDSVSLMAAAVDNIGDFLASLVAFFAARYALRPADEKFSWGYTKAEPLSTLSLGAFVCGSAFFLIVSSLSKMAAPTAVIMPEAVIIVMIFSIIITGALFLFQRRIAKQTQSTIIHADSIHYQMDFLLNIAVIAAMILQNFWVGFDALFGLLIAAYILWHTFSHIIRHAFEQLMDKELSNHDRNKIIAVIESYDDVINYHDLRTRRSGRYRFIQVHIDINQNLVLNHAHEIGDKIMVEIEAMFKPAEVIIHLDPVKPPKKAKTSWVEI